MHSQKDIIKTLNETDISGRKFSFCGIKFQYVDSSCIFLPVIETKEGYKYTFTMPSAGGRAEPLYSSDFSSDDDGWKSTESSFTFSSDNLLASEKHQHEKDVEEVKKLMQDIEKFQMREESI